MLFFVLSDDIQNAKIKLLTEENNAFDIVFPGVGDITSPGKYKQYLCDIKFWYLD